MASVKNEIIMPHTSHELDGKIVGKMRLKTDIERTVKLAMMQAFIIRVFLRIIVASIRLSDQEYLFAYFRVALPAE